MELLLETFQVQWSLGWILAAIGWLALLLALLCLRNMERNSAEERTELLTAKLKVGNLNRENDALYAQNVSYESRHKVLLGRLAELEPKADELDKMHERAVIVKAAYEQHIKAGKLGRTPMQSAQMQGKDNVHTWLIYLN